MKINILFTLLFSFILIVAYAHAQEENENIEDEKPLNPNIFIDVELEKDDVTVSPYKNQQDDVLSIFKNLQEIQKSKEIKKVDTLNENAVGIISKDNIRYVASAYLNCLIKNGLCQYYLDTLLEIDLINSKLDGSPNCKNMILFWKAWIENDMEKRHSHQTKIAFISDTNKFNREQRPKYSTKCKDTINKILVSSKDISPKEFFTSRYQDNSESLQFVKKTNEYLESVKESIDNIYFEIGMDR